MLSSSKNILTEIPTMFSHIFGPCSLAYLETKLTIKKVSSIKHVFRICFSPRLLHAHEWYFYSSKWSDQNLRFILYFSLLYIQSFSTFYKPYVQFTLRLSLLTTPTSHTLVQATIISCLEDNNNLLNCLFLPSFSPPFSPKKKPE